MAALPQNALRFPYPIKDLCTVSLLQLFLSLPNILSEYHYGGQWQIRKTFIRPKKEKTSRRVTEEDERHTMNVHTEQIEITATELHYRETNWQYYR